MNFFKLSLVTIALVSSGITIADSSQAKRPFARIEFPKAKLNIPVLTRPEWNYQVEPRDGTYAVLLSTPEKFYPSASMEVVLNHRLKVSPVKLESVALTALKEIRKKSSVPDDLVFSKLKSVTYGKIKGYEDRFIISQGESSYSVVSIMGVMPSGHPITIFLATPKGQMKHIKSVTHKMWNNIFELHDAN